MDHTFICIDLEGFFFDSHEEQKESTQEGIKFLTLKPRQQSPSFAPSTAFLSLSAMAYERTIEG